MKLIEILTDFFGDPIEQAVNKTPEGVCSLCWGLERYDGKIRELIEDKQVDINNHRARYMIIQEFVVDHIDGRKLKKAYTRDCDSCKNNE